ncbi:MAG: acyltransferase family protein [Nevskia sp.]|nr:acyltransferase family protein [Nevskia sp.]
MAIFGSLDLKQALATRLITPEIEALMARVPKSTGSFGYDAWGYNEDTTKLALAVCKLLYDKYFRVEASGLENIPARGRLLLISNHGGQLPFDGLMIGVAAATNPHGPRAVRGMIERFFPTVPWLGNLMNAMGGVIGDPLNCTKMLEAEEAILVFPEGVRGSGKLYKDRYQLQRFGTGFMYLAMHHHTPIVPLAVIGAEETMPALANLKPIAKLLGLPYFPLLPVYAPLPARISLHFGAPLYFKGESADEAEVGDRVEQVKDAIRKLIEQGLAARQSVF